MNTHVIGDRVLAIAWLITHARSPAFGRQNAYQTPPLGSARPQERKQP
jgi:hypothetical protein